MAPSAQRMHLKACILLVLLYPAYSGAIDLAQCLADVTSCATNPTGQNCTLNISNTTALSVLRTSTGSSVANYTDAVTAISYTGCINYCGKGQEPFSWTFFSQEYAVWLLPYLALLSQLPFGARRRTQNLLSVVLTLGSPTLAGYSLYITLLNARWLNDQLFPETDYPDPAVRQSVVRALNGLQQVPLRIHPGDSGRFESLLNHLANDQWWSTFADELDYNYTWSIASATSVTWVIIAYLLTVADSLSNVADHLNSNGQGTGTVWLWLLPIVMGWLILSPKCDYDRVHKAYRKANKHAFGPHSRDPSADSVQVTDFGLTISHSPDWTLSENDITSPDELRIPPVFNYSRTLLWCRNAHLISLFYHAAWRRSDPQDGADSQPIREKARGDVPKGSPLGRRHRDRTILYFRPDDSEYPAAKVLWPRGVFSNMVVASIMSLLLQWGTTSSAIIIVWFTPTTGLGCRSLAYLIYGALSTVVWLLHVLSSVLGYYAYRLANHLLPDLEDNTQPILSRPPKMSRIASMTSVTDNGSASPTGVAIPTREIQYPFAERAEVAPPITNTDESSSAANDKSVRAGWMYVRTMTWIAGWLGWIGKLLAIVNAIGIIVASVFQYAGVYDNCYCDSSILGLGISAGYAVVNPDARDISVATGAWVGALALALTSCTFFIGTIYLVRDSVPS